MSKLAAARAKGHVEYELTERHLLRLSNAAGRRIECVSGRALITAYGETTDFSLREGNVFIVPNNGLTLVEAIGNGRVRVKSPALPGQASLARTLRRAAELLRRIWHAVQGEQKALR
ncbi:DUF2917 domain-containing protein [Janthinobacterium fluminis]|uniref:DUF2917 domain-containing protein n=1 Tax=Janthinobacterium fluminis TaxID=2987524 RepID=A0ABT5K592_9BURK|nr:DUF2917 domain-containing protein [Janthinobacterium fluminis]MDC8760160.1 DUF2917 domain-containing protein [Janthinobacterium fluminis]